MNPSTRRLLAIGLAVALGLAAAYTASAAPNAASASHPRKATQASTARLGHAIGLVVKSDSEHGKKGPDGKWHDAFLPASFRINAGSPVTVTILNYDGSPHSFTSPSLHVNTIVPGAKGKTPGKATFTLKAAKPGTYQWWCTQPCDPWAMAHVGYMRGVVTVVG